MAADAILMRKILVFAVGACSLCVPLFANSVTGEYYDHAAWESAVAGGSLLKDNFDSNSVSLSGVAVASYISYNGLYSGPGQFSGGVWTDSIPKYGYTVWTFSQPIYAFGADFQMDVLDGLEFFSGLNLSMPNAVLPYVNNGQTREFAGFYGFISSSPLTSLTISWGTDGPPCACYGQSYTMDNLEISTAPVDAVAPEPSGLLLLGGLGLLLAARLQLRLCRRRNISLFHPPQNLP
ncbi:MAG TPA: hypothetical protein VH601_23745 [Bryobacteraceae bacterium]|jgi:hypothetical protein